MSQIRKSILVNYVRAWGLVVTGEETVAELTEAYNYLREGGRPTITDR